MGENASVLSRAQTTHVTIATCLGVHGHARYTRMYCICIALQLLSAVPRSNAPYSSTSAASLNQNAVAGTKRAPQSKHHLNSMSNLKERIYTNEKRLKQINVFRALYNFYLCNRRKINKTQKRKHGIGTRQN